MWLQPVQSHQIDDPSCTIPTLILPRQGHTQAEIVSQLEKFGAKNLQFPGNNMISAEINRDLIKNLQHLAIVEIKQTYQLRTRQNQSYC